MTMAIAVPTATAVDELSVGRGELVRDEAPSPASRRSQGTTRSGRSVASIPSKFPTAVPVAAVGPDLGFGSTAIRGWVASTSDPTPGPYQPVTTLIHRGGSVSCKGSGGFCSGTVRPTFAPRHLRETPAPGFCGVAEAAPPPEKVERETGNFIKPTVERERSAYSFGRDERVPGPGMYVTTAPRDVKNYRAAFASTSSRHKYKSFGPAPGAYDPSWRAYDAHGRDLAPKWSRSHTKRGNAPAPSYESSVDRAYLKALAIPGNEIVVPPTHVALKYENMRQAQRKQPGPEYDAMPAFDATRLDLKKATRKAWAHTLGADRWGRSQGRITHAPTPGPGWYDVAGAAARSRRRTALSSSFVSKTERKFLPKGSDAPGPAYYAPRRNRDSSFVLNDPGRWV